jgi:N-methylhydantoinase A
MQPIITQPPQNLRIGIDIGGTFTDFVVFNPSTGETVTFKLASTPNDPSEGVIAGLKRIWDQGSHPNNLRNPECWNIIHGSTVATNALLERKGARTALITTTGFKDVLQIGRQNRPELYSFTTEPVQCLVPHDLRLEVDGRVDIKGNILTPLDICQVDDAITVLRNYNQPFGVRSQPQVVSGSPVKIESVAVVTLFSFANPEHEKIIATRLRQAGFTVSASYEILPEYREYERTSTTVVNAYVTPVLERYLKNLEKSLSAGQYPVVQKSECKKSDERYSKRGDLETHFPKSTIQIMQSNGGCISVAEARQSGVRCVLSGPAGGVVGCQHVAKQAMCLWQSSSLNPQDSPLRLLTFDMGGTSTDVSLIDGEPKITSEAEVGGHPIRVPILDIHTIGAGGGSIAVVDAGGILRVGPKSAGADPGPACYGKGINRGSQAFLGRTTRASKLSPPPEGLLPTVTDANVILGRIPPDHFLGGEMPLYPELAEIALSQLGIQLNLDSQQIALGIIEIANAHMERALRVISVERGYDPSDFTLLSFGGAGGLHAVDLARRLRIPQVLIPPYASTLSAFGMLAADVIKDYTQTVMLPGEIPLAELTTKINPLVKRGRQEIQDEGFTLEAIQIEAYLDMRYRGQSYELMIPFLDGTNSGENFRNRFHQEHHRTYGYQRPEAALEIVNLRVRAIGKVNPPPLDFQPFQGEDPSIALMNYRPVVFMHGEQKVPFYWGERLEPGNLILGPAVVVRRDTTILISPGDSGRVDRLKNLILDVSG